MLSQLNAHQSKSGKRVGRGPASGKGKTSGRGMNGQNSRPGKKFYVGFEGGQTRLAKRVPKLRGFHNPTKKHYTIVKISQLNQFEAGTVITKAELLTARLINSSDAPVKLLADGDLDRALSIQVDRASRSAEDKVVRAGGSVITL